MLSPFRGFWDVRGEIDRMFDEAMRDAFRLWRGEGRAAPRAAAEWSPAMDVYSKDGDLVIKLELPGVKPEDVDITLQEGVLTISGQRKAEQEREGAGYYVKERRYGSFRRSMRLPEGVDESKIHARFEDGVLEVVVEGAGAVTEPRRIQIEGPKGS